ncbi:MAG: chemotaxis protein CheW, partial [Lentisphaeraceae bacterium]|nr:chemotaxis protein CheW [Lentisphaeraceae bacterium]
NLIFMPGFSTADEVTEISGRGVGMDVVLTNLKRLGGTVDLNSKEGEGTQLKISLPLTLAIMPSLLVSVCNETFAVPQVNLLQIVRVPIDEIHSKVQHTGSNLVIRFMNELIQLVRAEDFLKEDVEPIDFTHKTFGFKNHLYVLVVAAGELKYGIVVDQTLDSPEIVVKPFGRHLKHLSIYAGATILGSGDIAPIFDLLGIATELNITQLDNVDHEEDEEKSDQVGELQKLLIVQNGNKERLAVPLNNIVRIERISSEDIGSVGTMSTYEYMGKSIALFRVDDVADITKIRNDGKCSVVVFETMGRHLGLLVNEVIDSVEVVVDFDETTHKQAGILGSAFIDDHLVLLVDLFGVVAACKPEWVNKTGVHIQSHEQKHKILVIDDSSFFVNQISSFLDEAGYSSVQCMDGKEALDLLRSDPDVSLVLPDIEMPVMDGWEFIEEVRKDAALKDLPVLALTSVAGESSREKGLALGFNEYLIKLDREEILQNLKHYLYDQVTV